VSEQQTAAAPTAALPGETVARKGTPSLGVRIVGAGYVALFGAIFAVAVSTLWRTDVVTANKNLALLVKLFPLVLLYPAVLGGIAAATGLRPNDGVNVLGLPFEPRWFNTWWTLTSREVLSFFTTPVPYLVYTFYMFLNSFLFVVLVNFYAQPGGGGDMQAPGRLMFDNVVFWVTVWIACAALTMRLFAEEKKQGTIETLLTAPVTDIQVVLGKFSAALIFYSTMIGTQFLYMVLLSLGSRDWDWGPVVTAYLGAVLVGALHLAVGLFWSSLTQNQIIAVLLAVGSYLFLFFISFLEGLIKAEWARELLRYVSVHQQFQDFLIGVISTKSVVFFTSVTALFLFFTVRGLESQRWR
jgi:ABC-2 type transport system permease protein